MQEFFGAPTLGQRITAFVQKLLFDTIDNFTEEICKEFDLHKEDVSYNQDYTEVYVRTGGVTYVVRISRNPLEEVEV